MVHLVAGIVVVGFCAFLFGLAALIAASPSRAERLLRAFASSARAHYTEQSLRLLVGIALVSFASSMRYPDLFRIFGWLMAITAAALLLLPWRWHQQFGTRVIPLMIRYMRPFALGAAALGTFILYSTLD